MESQRIIVVMGMRQGGGAGGDTAEDFAGQLAFLVADLFTSDFSSWQWAFALGGPILDLLEEGWTTGGTGDDEGGEGGRRTSGGSELARCRSGGGVLSTSNAEKALDVGIRGKHQ